LSPECRPTSRADPGHLPMRCLPRQRGRLPAVCRPTSPGRPLAPTYRRLIQPAGPLARSLSAAVSGRTLSTYLQEACPASGAARPPSVGRCRRADPQYLPTGGLSSQRGRSPAVCRPLSVGGPSVPTYRRLVQPAGPLARRLSAAVGGRTLGENLGAAAVHLDGEKGEASPHNT
jgi:hypothetical protein